MATLFVDDCALLVHDVVIFEQVFAHTEVVLFHLLLCTFYGVADHFALQHFALLESELVHDAGNAFAGKESHEFVLEREEEHTGTYVTLTSGTSAKLTVHASAFVAFRTDDGKSSCLPHVFRELDVRTASCHIRGDGDGTEEAFLLMNFSGGVVGFVESFLPGLCRGLIAEGATVAGYVYLSGAALSGMGDDVSFLLVELGVEHLVVADLAHFQQSAEEFADVHAGGTYKTGTSARTHQFDFIDDGVVLFALCAVYAVIHVVTGDGLVRRNLHHVEFVDVPEFAGFGDGGTRHAGQFVVHSEIVLQGDGGEGLCGSLHLDVFLRFHCLVQAVAPAASFHDASGLLIHNLHLSVHDDVVFVLVEHGVCLQKLLECVHTVADGGIFCHQFVLLGHTFLFRHIGGVEGGQLCGDIGEHKEVGILYLI